MTEDIFTPEELATEVWKDVPDFEGYYKVSNLGRIKSLPRIHYDKLNRKKPISERLLCAPKNSKRYPSVLLVKDDFNRKYTVHRLVAAAFYGKSDMVVDHINNIRHDNRLSNLEYVSQQENLLRAVKSKRGFNGCYFSNRNKRWIARFWVDGKKRTKSFLTIKEAQSYYEAKAALQAARAYKAGV